MLVRLTSDCDAADAWGAERVDESLLCLNRRMPEDSASPTEDLTDGTMVSPRDDDLAEGEIWSPRVAQGQLAASDALPAEADGPGGGMQSQYSLMVAMICAPMQQGR